MTAAETIFNWRRIDARISTSGQPSEAQLASLAASGVRHVINLAPHSHERALPDEAASVAALGMAYVYRPVDFNKPTEADFAAFCRAMAALGDDPVHVHCAANYRVSAFFYRYRRDVVGADANVARATMDDVWQPTGVWAGFVAMKPLEDGHT